jgi:hypothetical protein
MLKPRRGQHHGEALLFIHCSSLTQHPPRCHRMWVDPSSGRSLPASVTAAAPPECRAEGYPLPETGRSGGVGLHGGTLETVAIPCNGAWAGAPWAFLLPPGPAQRLSRQESPSGCWDGQRVTARPVSLVGGPRPKEAHRCGRGNEMPSSRPYICLAVTARGDTMQLP